jgi:hypothetical protein
VFTFFAAMLMVSFLAPQVLYYSYGVPSVEEYTEIAKFFCENDTIAQVVSGQWGNLAQESDQDDVHLKSGGRRERPQVIRIGREEDISVLHEQHEGRIDDVEGRLTAGPAPPDLPHHAAMSQRRTSLQKFLLDQGDCLPIRPLDADERACVQDKPHLALRRRAPELVRGPPPRAATAVGRARRAAARTSSGVISPCSASYAATNDARAASLRSWATLRRSASLTQALTLPLRPRATARSAASIRSPSTDADNRCLAFTRSC